MQLVLRIKSFCGKPPASAQSLSFTSFPIIIGRSINCDFRLEDPSRYISSNHAVISIENSILRVQDCSSNGVFINNSNNPVGRLQLATIEHGDLISIGDYTLEILVNETSDNQVAVSKPTSDDPFDVFENTDLFTHEKSSHATQAAHQNLDPFASDEWHKGIGESASNAAPAKPLPSARSAPPAQETVALQVAPEPRSDNPWDEPNEKRPIPQHAAQQQQAEANYEQRRSHPQAARPKRNYPQESSRERNAIATPRNSAEFKAFLEGAGLDQQQINATYTSSDPRQAGKVLAQLTEGMMELLRARAKIKHAIRSDMTALSRTNNNPLKFSYSAEEAVSKLLSKNSEPGYLPAKQAVKQATDDLNLHQLAMLEGMKAAVAALVREFDPAILEKKLESESPISASIPGRKQAKLWESFEERYAVLRDEAVNDFDELFGREFRKAYERKIKELGRSPDF